MIGLEMNQNFQVAKSQLVSDGKIARREDFRVIMGENPSIIIAKSIENPESLIHSEKLVVDAYLSIAISSVQRLISIRDTGIYTDDLTFMNSIVNQEWVGFYFGNSYAKPWFRKLYATEPGQKSEILVAIAKKISSVPNDASWKFQNPDAVE
jgi:hypothetical protein